ncbi:MAG: hypothetical protein IPN89_18240 [Saprospiraceae bacterium]|nr:hypothetical protein [Saprospiraceae bacterium]
MGQAVYNVTIDGDDLTGKRYQLITNSLSALAVQKVDIVYNYIENKLLSDIFESSAVSVNLVTDEQYQMKWNAAVSLGGSHINYDMQFSPIGLFKKMKIIGDVSGNNIGKGMFGLSDFNNSFITPLFISEVIDDKIDTRYSNFERDIIVSMKKELPIQVFCIRLIATLSSNSTMIWVGAFFKNKQHKFLTDQMTKY